MPPSEWAEQEQNELEAAGDGAAALPADVAASMRAFVATLTTPETELEQQLLEAATRWSVRHDPPAVSVPNGHNPCLAGSSISNTRSSSHPSWNGGANGDQLAAGSEAPADDASSSGRSSEEGSSAAWRLAAWLQRQGWPAQHCASFRNGSSGVGGSGTGWRFTSGHEFVLVYPHQRGGGPDPGGGADHAAESASSSGGSSASGDTDARFASMAADMETDMACDASAIVVDPEFATQFALTSPTPRYQAVVSLLPRVFVGSYDRLHRLVEWAWREMQASFQGSGSGLPPWRSLGHVLSKWRLQGGSRSGSPGAQPAEDPAVPCAASPPGVPQEQRGALAGPASAPAACGTAFSAEQQQAMRSLLLHSPVAQPAHGGRIAVPPPPLSAHSSMSSMDTAPALVGASSAVSPASPLAPPRSLLTAELQQMAQAAARQAQEQGPAAAILSLAHGCGQASPWSPTAGLE
ncbi:hypothetical protein ABPG75_001995 [Micractinium tetrahymenae]